MLPDEKIGCHRLPRTCFHGVTAERCQLWTNVAGIHPQTGAVVDRWGCADAFVPLLLAEIAQKANQTSAEVHELRNDIVKSEQRAQEAQRGFRDALANTYGGQLLTK